MRGGWGGIERIGWCTDRRSFGRTRGLPVGAEADARLLIAISFAFISVVVGIFATYDDVLVNAGPVVGLLIGGGIYFVGLSMFNLEVLETECGGGGI